MYIYREILHTPKHANGYASTTRENVFELCLNILPLSAP